MSKHFLIVGASSGIGAELLRMLSARGAAVTHVSRHPEHAPDVPMARGLRWDARSDEFPVCYVSFRSGNETVHHRGPDCFALSCHPILERWSIRNREAL